MKPEKIEFCGESAVRGSNGLLEATLVPGWGSNLVKLKYLPKGIDLLRAPNTADEYWGRPILYGIPVLFPPNRIEDGTFVFEGRTYRFQLNEPANNNHSHGLLFERPWELVRAESKDGRIEFETRIDSRFHPKILEQFPHEFRVQMAYILEGSSLRQQMTVINDSDKNMPCGIGYHTTFRFPFRQGDPLDDCRFGLTADRHWELNRRFLPTGQHRPISYGEELRSGMSLADLPLDDVYSALPNGLNEAVLDDPNAGLRLTYRCGDEFKYWVIYNNDARQGYLCPEPYTWITNAPNVDLSPETTGFRYLPPGERLTVTTEIIVEDRNS